MFQSILKQKATAYLALLLAGLTWANTFAFGVHSVSDFMQDYGAGLAVISGNSIYQDFVFSWAKSLCSKCEIDNFHPPFVAILMLPFASFDYFSAAITYSVLSLVLYLSIIWSIVSQLKLSETGRIYFFAGALVWHPFISNTVLLQVSVYLTAIIFCAFRLIKDRDSISSGICLGLAASIKLFPLAFAFYLILARKWIALISMTLTFLATIVLALLVIGLGDIKFYISHVMPRNVAEWGSMPINQSLFGLWEMFSKSSNYIKAAFEIETSIAQIHFIFAVVVVLFTAFHARRLLRYGSSEAAFSLFCIGMLVASPISWSHGFIILLIPISYIFGLVRNGILDLKSVAIALILASVPDLYLARLLYAAHTPELIPWYTALLLKAPLLGLCYLFYLILRGTKMCMYASKN